MALSLLKIKVPVNIRERVKYEKVNSNDDGRDGCVWGRASFSWMLLVWALPDEKNVLRQGKSCS